MDDIPTSSNATATAAAAGPTPTPTPPTHQSPIDQATNVAKKFLAMITGRPQELARTRSLATQPKAREVNMLTVLLIILLVGTLAGFGLHRRGRRNTR